MTEKSLQPPYPVTLITKKAHTVNTDRAYISSAYRIVGKVGLRHRDIFYALYVERLLLPKYNDNFGPLRIFRRKLNY